MATRWFFSAKRFAALHGAFIPLFVVAAAPPDSCSSPSTCGAAGVGGAPDGSVSCVYDTRVSSCGTGLVKASASGAYRIRIESASPNPPAKGMNSWVIRAVDASGGPRSGVRVAVHTQEADQDPTTPPEADPYMPDHLHWSGTTPTLSPNSDGTYSVGNMNFWMAGVWRMGFDIFDLSRVQSPTDLPEDSIYFYFCIPG
ncbi:MAG TPA: hypothetical protein VK524_30575 [Polyangiaceae bacterium]|nr:hypothetical protein [Polyangiaceae bacterium]